ASVRVARVDDLVPRYEVQKRIEGEPADCDRVTDTAVELRIRLAEDHTIRRGDRPVAVDVLDLVLSRHTLDGVRQIALIALLPETDHPIAVDRAERLADANYVGFRRTEETADAARRHQYLFEVYALALRIQRRAEIQNLVAIGGDVERAAPAESVALEVDRVQ